MTENEQQQQEEELSEIELAELANKEIKARDDEISRLKKALAKEKLYSKAEDDEESLPSREDCIKQLSDPHISNYDYAKAVVGLCDVEAAEGRPNPLGPDGDAVYGLFKDCIDECNGDKSRFVSIYQSKVANDAASTAMAYNKRKMK